MTVVEYIMSEGFLQGVNSYRRRERLNPDRYDDVRTQIRYEIGRQFAVYYPGPIKQGRQVNAECVRALAWLAHNKFLRP